MVMFITLYKEFMSECQSSTAHAVACNKNKKAKYFHYNCTVNQI